MNIIGRDIDGRYQILELIGKGGMANVYKSLDKQLGRYVAVKVLKEDYRDDKEFVRRFNVEAQAAARLSNPHIVSIYDVGCEDGLHYIVMELIEGETLKDYIERIGVIPWREAADYSIQICEGIEEAHNNSVIHRDIKPQNIIMAADGILKITDFGIARATTQATMTMVNNNTIGTAHYLSPEQARGGYTDERTDIYSMGVVMYEMLTGTLPFDDNSPVAIAIKHLQENATPVSQINPEVPSSFEHIVMKAMAKEQDRRYTSVTDMITDLEKMLNNPDIDLYSDGVQKRRRSLDELFADEDNTLKMPRIEDTGEMDWGDYDGYDDWADEQNEEYEAMERLNEKRARRIKRKKDRKVAFVAFLSALAVLAVGFAVSYAVTDGFGIFGTQKDRTEIPSVIGMTLKDAQKQYGKEFSIIEKSKKESTKPVGTILEQTPTGGQMVNKSDSIIINVVVSSGANSVDLPNYVGVKAEEASKQIEELGLNCRINEVANPDVEQGIVFEQYPSAGSKVPSGNLITLTVSKGPASSASPNEEKTTEKPEKPSETKKPENRSTPKPEAPAPTKKPSSSSENNTSNSGGGTTGGSEGGSESGSGSSSESSSGGESSGGNAGSSDNGDGGLEA